MNIKIPAKKNLNYIKKYFLNHKLNILFNKKNYNHNIKFQPNIPQQKIIPPDLNDLYYIHQLILLNKRLTILEFGSGWSSLILLHALNLNKKKYTNKTNNLRIHELFQLYILETSKKYLLNTKKRNSLFFSKSERKNINYFLSKIKMTTFNNRFCTEYLNLPIVNPDFIYLDGPSPYDVSNNIFGFTTAHPDMMPMASDILKIENFLVPGTIILIDGRTANTTFLLNNFQRKWKYFKLKFCDFHVLVLNDPPLGEHNKRQLKFYMEA